MCRGYKRILIHLWLKVRPTLHGVGFFRVELSLALYQCAPFIEKAIMPVLPRLSNRSEGQFNYRNWIEEGDGLFASSAQVRRSWQKHRSQHSKNIFGKNGVSGPSAPDDWHLLTGLPRSSMLLLGYATEMYLKAAITKAYRGCSNDMFNRDVRSRFGHKFIKMAEEIAFPKTSLDIESLNNLKEMVLVDARYPVFIKEHETYVKTVNQRTFKIWSEDGYQSLSALVQRVREHALKIDGDEANPSSFYSVSIDSDGYLAFRVGGHLPPRITFRISTLMRESNKTSVSDVKAIFETNGFSDLQLLRFWDRAFIYEDGLKSDGSPTTSRHQQPPI